ncbi:MAG TPA: hypothetical protein PKW95_02750 [bacterium]|nr:hypothetical protein [bacterium]
MENWKGRALGSILFESKMISQQDIEQALAEQRRTGVRFGEALINLKIVSSEDVNWGLAQQFNIPFVRIHSEAIDPEAVRLLPEEVARRHKLLPYLLIDDELTVVMEDPTSKRAVSDVETITGKRVNVAVGLPEDIEARLDEVYGDKAFGHIIVEDFASDRFDEAQIAAIKADFSGEAFLQQLFRLAVEEQVGSVHLTPQGDSVTARFRTPIGLVDVAQLSLAWSRVVNKQLKLKLEYSQRRPGFCEGFYRIESEDGKHIFHASLVETPAGESLTLINIAAPTMPTSLSALLAEEHDDLALLQDMLHSRHGLLIVLGADRAEKHQLLDLMLREKNADRQKTIIIGRMPWFIDSGFVQLRHHGECLGDQLDTLHYCASQDPDIVVIDDMSHAALLHCMQTAAQGPCFIFGNLRFSSALAGLEFLVETTESRTLLCDGLRGLTTLNVYRRLCPECKQVDDRSAQASRILGLPRAQTDQATLRKAAGCPACRNTGYQGIVPVVEVLPITPALCDLVKSGDPFVKIRPQLEALHGRSTAAKTKQLILAGIIGLDEYSPVTGMSNNGADR